MKTLIVGMGNVSVMRGWMLSQAGVDAGTYPDAQLFLLPDVEDAARKLRQLIIGMPHYERTRAHSHFDTSPEELRRLCLDVIETGEELGVPMPTLGSLKKKLSGGG